MALTKAHNRMIADDRVNVKDFGALGNGTADDTVAIQAALDTGKSVYFPAGVYLTEEVTIPFSARGTVYSGDGFYHYSSTQQTVIKAKTLGQNSIFKIGNSGVSGSDCLTIEQMKLDCDNKSDMGIDATYGSFLHLYRIGVYDATDYGVYCKQGLARIDNCFMTGSDTAQLHLYSDSTVTNSEFSGGEYGIKIVAGGNRLNNIWANTSTEACVYLTPFDATTTHINTSISNLYAGETSGGAVSKPIVYMLGTASQKVQQVQITNSHLVSAASNDPKINGGIYMKYCKDTVISNIAYLGNGSYATATRYTDYFVKIEECEQTSISNCSVNGVENNPVYMTTNAGKVTVSGCVFRDWGIGGVASGNAFAAVRVDAGNAVITGCSFDIATSDTGPFACYSVSAAATLFEGNLYRYPNATVISTGSGTATGIYKNASGAQVVASNISVAGSTIANSTTNNAGQNYLSTGQVASTGSGSAETLSMTTLASVSEQQVYLATVGQQGSGAHSAMYYINVYGSNIGVVRISGDDAVPGANAVQISNSGLTLQAVIGSGYSALTWRWAITRLI